ncbi:MAG: biotin-dependent carboxyltransferase family protein [Chitinophagaceae bacterium]|nr:MAG: biotin-dependent carboxyltransferase family protein [Chitinophagaceae bacterium]
MSLQITRAGLLDTIQDAGRYGFQHLGINPGGAMDRFAASLANALLGKNLQAPVIELHFPSAQVVFQQPAIICLAGANFSTTINGTSVPLHQPIAVGKGATLMFTRKLSGARCYLSLYNELQLTPWLNSYSTNLKAAAGGFAGRKLLRGDVIAFSDLNMGVEKDFEILPWQYKAEQVHSNVIDVIAGPEWDWLTNESKALFTNNVFSISPASDRMGYRLQGEGLQQDNKEQLLSSGVGFGTVQLLPNGQLVVLMADHQTTGGYPRIASVISAHLPRLAQKGTGESLQFAQTSVAAAEAKWIRLQKFLHDLQNTCKLKLQTWRNAH